MSNQFKVGDTVRLTAYARAELSRLEAIFGDSLLRVCEGDVLGYGPDIVCFAKLSGGDTDSCHYDYLEFVDLRDRKALLVSEIAKIDKVLSEQAQGDGLARLRSIVEETGYFRVNGCFFQYDPKGGVKDTMVSECVRVEFLSGYCFFYDHAPSARKAKQGQDGMWAIYDDWSSIPRERFEKARADYEAIVEQVKEAMRP
jgi:hypothetical protein